MIRQLISRYFVKDQATHGLAMRSSGTLTGCPSSCNNLL